jgi:hypothetical protein
MQDYELPVLRYRESLGLRLERQGAHQQQEEKGYLGGTDVQGESERLNSSGCVMRR